MSLIIPKYFKKELYLDEILEANLGDTYAIIRKIKTPEQKYLDDMIIHTNPNLYQDYLL